MKMFLIFELALFISIAPSIYTVFSLQQGKCGHTNDDSFHSERHLELLLRFRNFHLKDRLEKLFLSRQNIPLFQNRQTIFLASEKSSLMKKNHLYHHLSVREILCIPHVVASLLFPHYKLLKESLLCALARQPTAPSDAITKVFCCFLEVNLCIYRTYFMGEHSLLSRALNLLLLPW